MSSTNTDRKEPEQAADACPLCHTRCCYFKEVVTLRDENRELSELVRTDTLTTLYNFRYFMQALEMEMERTRRSQQATVLIIADLDHFKAINDTWGHDLGNRALKHTASLVRQAIRKLDIPCRYGGEEFAIILPSTELLIGLQVAERLRGLLEQTPLSVADQEIRLTASFGVDVFSASHTDTQETFIDRTDKHLYKAKEAGRNCVHHGTSDQIDTNSTVSSDEKDALYELFNRRED